jgi:hypothetical protein
MALVLYNSSPTIATIGNNMPWSFIDTDNYTRDNFKYVIKVYETDQITGLVKSNLGTYKTIPAPILGEFSLNRILNSKIDYSAAFLTQSAFNPTQFNNIVSSDNNGYVRYKLAYGEEWNPGLTFTTVLNVSGYYGLTFSSVHNFEVNDTIFVSTINNDLNGISTVTNILGSYSVKLDRTFTSTPVSYGSVTYLERMVGTTSNTHFGYNGAIDYGQENVFNYVNDNLVFSYDVAIAPIASGQFLTPFGKTASQTAKKVLEKDFETLTFLLPLTYYAYALTFKLKTTVYDDQWNLSATYSQNLNTLNGLNKLVLGVGPGNLYFQGIVPTIINYNNYSIRLEWLYGTYSQQTQEQYFTVEQTCSPFNNVRLMWINRLGGFDFFNFRMNSQRNETIERKEFRRPLGPYYQTGDRPKTQLKVDVTEEWTINTDWITEKEYLALNDLLTSLEVYVLKQTYDDSGSPVHTTYPIVIVDNTYTQKTQLTDKIFNMTLTYRQAYEKYIQSN